MKEGDRMQKRVSFVVVLIGLLLVGYGVGSYYYDQHSNNDKKKCCTAVTTGRVENCTMQKIRHHRRRAASWTEYLYRVTYSYTVEGKEYTQKQRLNYGVNKTVEVHYDPDEPGKAYIGATPEDPRRNQRTFAVLGGWVVFFGIVLIFVRPLDYKKKRS